MLNALLVDMAALGKAFEIMWKGCLAIAIVIALVLLVTTVVNKACIEIESKAAQKKNEGQNSNQNK